MWFVPETPDWMCSLIHAGPKAGSSVSICFWTEMT